MKVSLYTSPLHRPAETPVPDDYLCDPPPDSKRYAVDPSDSAFNVTTSQYPVKHLYGYRSSSCSGPAGLCRQASSPASFQEGNRHGEFALGHGWDFKSAILVLSPEV